MGSVDTHPIIAQAIKYFGSQTRMAAAIGSSQSAVSRMLLMEISVTAEIAIKIEQATGGKFPRWEMRPDLWPAARRRKRSAVSNAEARP